MKKTISLITALLTLIISLGTTAQPKSNPADKSLLWRITGKKLTKPSYLFGTMHLICRGDYVWTEKMKESLAKSEQVCFEMNLNDPNVISEASIGLVQALLAKMQKDLGGEELKMIESFLKDSMGHTDLSGKTSPMGLSALSGAAGLSCDDPVSYEDSIMTLALADSKKITGLEEPKEQIDVLMSLPLDSLMNMLMTGTMPDDSKGGENAELTKAYKNQDLPALYELIAGNKEPGFDLSAFLDKRNIKWIPRMSDKMNLASVFFAVGAGHLYGPNGVINLLRKAGYTVEPIK